MAFKQEIEEHLRVLQSQYEKLESFIPFNRLKEGSLPENPADPVFLVNIGKIVRETREIQSLMDAAYTTYGKAVHFIDTSLHSFWENIACPSWQAIRRIYADHHPDGFFEDLLMESEEAGVQASPRQDIARTMRAALSYFDDTLDEDDERRDEIFDFNGAHALLESPLFQPDAWANNNRLLPPVLQRQTDVWFP